jgi:glucosamine-6-phosphate deaminase
VPGPQKAAAIAAMLDGPVSTACPASVLRGHPDARMFVDEAAASGVEASASAAEAAAPA